MRTDLLGLALLLVLAAAVPGLPAPLGTAGARAASPQPSAGTGDTRSAGEAPSFVGAPLAAIAAVLGLGALAAAATIGYVRLTGGPGRDDPGASDSPTP
jgi:hypothetical protein